MKTANLPFINKGLDEVLTRLLSGTAKAGNPKFIPERIRRIKRSLMHLTLLMAILLGFIQHNFGQTSQTITTPGNGTFTAPAGVTTVTVKAWGAGGGGGGATGSGSHSGNGGGGGGFALSNNVTLGSGGTASYTVGTGGTAGSSSGGNGGAGGSTTFSNATTATGGSGGAGNNSSSTATTGGTGIHNGGTGAVGTTTPTSGGGGGGAGDNGNGGNGSASSSGGTGGSAGNGNPDAGGAGGNGGAANSAGNNGTAPGGGGGGAQRTSGSGASVQGGIGANGKLIISWTCPTYALSSPLTASWCSGVSNSYTATSTTTGLTFSWTRAVVTGISNSTGSGSSSTITETLINTTPNPINVVYVFTLSSTTSAGTCSNTQNVTITVNPTNAVSVSIGANPSGAICPGTSVTFTATPTNGGTTPSYQWKKNGNNVGTNSATYTNAGLSNNDAITCVLTSNISCPSGNPATSNTITMAVNTANAVSVSIGASPSGAICPGTSVTFTATPVNGGTTPSYQWKKNGNNIGTNSATYTDASLNNNDAITCVLTSNVNCPSGNPATSNTITMAVSSANAVSVSIGASPSGAICTGTSVTFTATPTNGGSTPVYQWKKNGNNVGTNSATYTDAGLNNNDAISCILTSNVSCASGNPATSNTINMTVNPIPSAPVVTTPVYYGLNTTASPLTAIGTNLLWYTAATGGTGSLTAPTPSTATAGTFSWWVSQTVSGCESPRARIDVQVSAVPIANVTGQKNVTCYAGTDGTIEVTASGGTPPYSFSKDNGATWTGTESNPYTFTGLNATTPYKIRVKDSKGIASKVIQ